MTTNQIKNILTVFSKFLFGICLLLFIGLLFPVEAQEKASLFFSPSSETFIKGEYFSVELKVDTKGFPINAAQASISFPSDKLELVGVSKENSIFSLWTEEPRVNKNKIFLSGGIPHPGFNGVGSIVSINFLARELGNAEIYIEDGKVLADDGKGTDILMFIKEAKYSIQEESIILQENIEELLNDISFAPQVFCSTHPDSNQWYNNSNPRFQWKLTPDTDKVSFILDSNPDTLPDDISEGLLQEKYFEEVKDGVWYFHLKIAEKGKWSPVAHYKIQIDNSPPDYFEIVVDNYGDSTNPNPDLYFETRDNVSGIENYRFKVDDNNFLDLLQAQINPFSLSDLTTGVHSIVVRATDKAGNNVEAKAVIEVDQVEPPTVNIWPEKYVAGEEILYLEGTSLPGSEVILFLNKEEKEIKTWIVLTDSQGQWSLSTKELIEPGLYSLFAQARTDNGAISSYSDPRQLRVILSGLALGFLIVSFKELVSFLALILLIGIGVAIYFINKVIKKKRSLRKETDEAKLVLSSSFNRLRKDIEKKVEMIDSKPGFSEKEKKVYEELKEVLDNSEKAINKEIDDIEKGLK